MRNWRRRSKLLLALILAAFAWFVWPTPWRYVSGWPVARVHRVTGRAEVLSGAPEGWTVLDAGKASRIISVLLKQSSSFRQQEQPRVMVWDGETQQFREREAGRENRFTEAERQPNPFIEAERQRGRTFGDIAAEQEEQ